MKDKWYITSLIISTIILLFIMIIWTMELFDWIIFNYILRELFMLIAIFIGIITFIMFYFHDKKLEQEKNKEVNK